MFNIVSISVRYSYNIRPIFRNRVDRGDFCEWAKRIFLFEWTGVHARSAQPPRGCRSASNFIMYWN